MKIAIIGFSGLFPGSSTNEEFWQNLLGEKDLTSLAHQEDFGVDPQLFYNAQKGKIDRCYSLRGGYIRGFEFDPTGYQLPADFLARQDKLYQWSLYVAKTALEQSGYANQKEALNKCGLILGNLSFPTNSSHRLLADLYTQTTEKALQELLNDKNFRIPANQLPLPDNEILTDSPSQMVAKGLGLGAGHYELDAACATSLYAIKLACDELMTGKADLMLAGAVCGSDQLFIHMGFSIFHAYAPHGQTFAPLDRDSGGLVSAEGAGMVVLKRLKDAQRDGDNILGLIGGIGLSNDGRGKFLLSPNPKGQQLALERAYDLEDVLPQNTSYLECHATGTPLGDVTEMNSISNFFEQYQTKPLLGSVKSNMGHLLTAAGMTGLFKVLLSMQKGIIPPNINLKNAVQTQNQWIKDEQIIRQATPWQGAQAGINSFGFGGTNAHLVVQKPTSNHLETSVSSVPTKLQAMAIVGMDAHFGSCGQLEDFYAAIYNGKQDFRPLPAQRWKGFDANKALLKGYGLEQGKAPKGAYIEQFDIDLLRYKIQPKEAETLEPQQALILKVADKALQDANIQEGQNIAVLIAMESELAIHHYLARWDSVWQLEQAIAQSGLLLSKEQKEVLEEYSKNALYFRTGSQSPSQHTSFVGNIMASRIAALWDFSGPAFTVSCGDNAVFKALEVAQNMLSLGEVDAVVVGGVDFCGGLENVLLRQAKEASSTNKAPSLFLNQGQKGWLVGEGAGAVVLQKASTAQAKQARIYAVIDAIGTATQQLDVGYQELVSSGYAQEDAQELEQLLATQLAQKTALGSVKTSFGHTGAASGIAALIKTALCLHHRFIPGIPNWQKPNSSAFATTNYYFPVASRPWLVDADQKRQAVVNGLDGLQVCLSEGVQQNTAKSPLLQGRLGHLFIIKENTEAALHQALNNLQEAINQQLTLAKLAAHLYYNNNQKETKYNLVLLASNRLQLQQEIRFMQVGLETALAEKRVIKTPRGSYFTPQPLGKAGKIAFSYPGSATAYRGLGQDIFQLFPSLHQHFASKLDDMASFVGSSYLHPQLQEAQAAAPNIHQDAVSMMCAGVFSSAIYTHLFKDVFGLQPNLAFGYSMGESAGMWYSFDVWNARNTFQFRNSDLFANQLSGDLQLLADTWGISCEAAKACWTSLVLLADRAKVEALVAQEERCYLSFVNTPQEVIISGDKAACNRVVQALQCTTIAVPFQNIIHHDFCQAIEQELYAMHHFPLEKKPPVQFYSSLTLAPLPMDSAAIAQNSSQLCFQLVDYPATIQHLYKQGVRIFIELGAGNTCSQWTNKILGRQAHLAVSCTQKGKTEGTALLQTLAQLVGHGVPLDLSNLFAKELLNPMASPFNKTIVVGGLRIFDFLLQNNIQQQFADIPKMKPVAMAALETVTATTGPFGKNTALSSFTSTQTTISVKKTASILSPNTAKKTVVGENGLKLQDFNDPNHLKNKTIIFSQEDLEEFATGKIAKVFGEKYAPIDEYTRRVMLPMHPYLLVSRVTGLEAKLGEFKPSTMQTEYDIPYNAWFTTDGQIPWAVSVESGQCDLLLISYLGIDFENKGNLVYRLLDCTLTFVDDLPFEGQTLRYDISINSFVKNGDNLLFFFSYNCYVEDRLVLKMRNGCAGFFTDEQLNEGLGVVYSKEEIAAKINAQKPTFTPLLSTNKTSFDKTDLRHLIDGNMELCFESMAYYANGRNPSLRLPPEQILMIDRIVSVDLKGGAYHLGYVIAEKDLAPDDWYFPCHFRDDEVLAGSLQAEGGGNLLRFFMLMLGLQRLTKDARYQPIFDLPQKVRCRKQVTPAQDTKLVYRLEVKEIGLVPNPYVIADLEIVSNGIITVHFENLGLQLREKDSPRYLEKETGIAIAPRSKGALLNELDITNFALNNLSEAFGADFACYDGRTVSRQPNTDLQLISRVLRIEGERLNFKRPSTIYAEYDVPVNAWYYQQNASATMPYSILMEIALQPCGLLGAYLGSTLPFADKNLFFRNLDGTGELLELPMGTDWRGKTIHNKAVLVSSVALGGTVLQNYTFELSIDEQVFYKGKSSFGFFPADALAQQVGLDNGKAVAPWYQQQNLAPKDYIRINLDSLYGKMKLFKAPSSKPHYHLAGEQLALLDHLKIVKDGGKYGKGYIYGHQAINLYDWFFTCHFYQDPVMPGSLGVEAILQAMQTFALQQNLAKGFKSPRFVQLPNNTTVWKYRGQILKGVRNMHCEVHFKTIEQDGEQLVIIGDAYLWNEQTRIYQITDLALGIEEA